MKKFNTFSEAYLSIIEDIIEYGEWVEGVKDPYSIGSSFGQKIRKTKEILVYTFCVSSPENRLLDVRHKEINKKFALANFLWTLLGTKDGSTIIRFNSNGLNFIDKNCEFNSAIGSHLFKLHNNAFVEFERIEKLLKRDPSTRRAIVQFFNQEDIFKKTKDVPCYNHLQFFLRKNQLDCHVVMRSQSALMVLPYDFYLFSMLHECMATRLSISLGSLYYTCNSIHIYEDEMELAYKIEKKDEEKNKNLKMEAFDNLTIHELKKFFTDFANYVATPDLIPNPISCISKYQLNNYWIITIKSLMQ